VTCKCCEEMDVAEWKAVTTIGATMDYYAVTRKPAPGWLG
jgi:hypothetical protein